MLAITSALADCDTHLAQDLGIAENNDTILRSRQSDVETTRIVQETDALVFIASDTGQDDIVLFSTLESVYTGDFDFLVEILLQRAVVLHIVDDVAALTLVWRNDTDLRRQYA